MSRRRVAAKKAIMPDPVYQSRLVSYFVNCLMRDGKKSIAERIIYTALHELGRRKLRNSQHQTSDSEGSDSDHGTGGFHPVIDLFDKALDNVRPMLEVRSRRVGGATYQIPVEVPAARRTTLAIRWIIASALSRGEKDMALRLAGEFADALEGRGGAVKKRDDTHKMAKANQAFAHFIR